MAERSRARDVAALLLAALTAALVAAAAGGVSPIIAVLLPFAAAAALAALASMRVARLAVAVAAGTMLAAAWLDAHLRALYGIHLYDRAALDVMRAGGANDVVHLSLRERAMIALAVAAAAAAVYVIALGWARLVARVRLRALVAAAVVATVASEAAAFVVARRPLGDVLAGGHQPLEIHYPKLPPGARATLPRKPNIVLVLVETLRADMLTPEYMPELSRLVDARACDRSERHWSASHVTDFSFFALVYGLNAYYYLPFAQQKVPSYALRVFKDNGYAVVGAASSPLAKWGDLGDLTRQFDSFADFDGKDPAERDRQLADWAERWPREHRDKPWLMLLFFDATHHRYYYPPAFERFRPALPETHDLVTGKVTDPEVRREFVNRYENSVGYVDHLVAEVARTAGDDTVVVVTGDHGEEFWDNGLLGHTAVSFVNARTEVPFVMCTPERRARRFPRSSEVDIMPTLLGQAGLSLPPDDYASGVSLVGDDVDPDRFLLVSGMGFPFTNRQVCLISRTRKYWLEKERTGAKRFVLVRATDLDDREAPPVGDELARGIDALTRNYRRFFSP